MGQYNLLFADTNLSTKSVIRGTSGTTGILQLKIVDETGAAFNFTGMTVVAKIYIGVEGTLLVNTDLTTTTAATGLATYNIAWADFANDTTEAGRFEVEVYLADNAVPTKSITAGTAILKIVPSIID